MGFMDVISDNLGGIIGGVGSIVGGIMGGDAAEDAANQQIDALNRASGISAEAAAQARADLLGTFNPAFSQFALGTSGAIDALTSGKMSAQDFLTQSNLAAAQSRAAGTQQMAGALTGQGPGAVPGFGGTQARTDIQQGTLEGMRQLLGGEASALQAYRGSLDDAIKAAQGNITGAIGRLGGGAGKIKTVSPDFGVIDPRIERAVGELETFAGLGEEAAQREAALSGVLGAEAQQAAIDQFIESPGQQFLREREEQALLRSAAATGGLQGGNVLSALQEQAVGIAAGQQQQQLDNLRRIAQSGLSAASGQSGAELTGAQLAGSLESQRMSEQQSAYNLAAQLRNQRAIQAASLQASLGGKLANMILGTGANIAGLEQQTGLAGLQTMLGQGQQLADISQQTGTNLANIFGSAGQADAAAQLALGQQLAGLEELGAANVANLYSKFGSGAADMLTGLGSNLANVALGQGTQQSNLAQSMGATQAAGTLGQNAAMQSLLSGLTQTGAGLFA